MARKKTTSRNFEGAYLEAGHFQNMKLVNRSFRKSTLTNAVFEGCDLRADFTEAYLRGVIFEGCDLRGADFTEAYLRGVIFEDCKTRGVVGLIPGPEHDGYYAFGWLWEGRLMLQVGCRHMRVEEYRHHVAARASRMREILKTGADRRVTKADVLEHYDRRRELASVDYIEAIAEIRGWKL